jgi:hypothetical protein
VGVVLADVVHATQPRRDRERLRIDPAMRRVVGGRAKEREAASTSEMSRFETEMLSSGQNLTALMNLSGTWIDRVQECVPLDKLIMDLGSSVSPTHGEQQLIGWRRQSHQLRIEWGTSWESSLPTGTSSYAQRAPA